MYGPAGFEDFSDDDEFDFGDGGRGGFQFSSNHNRPVSTPKQPSFSPADNGHKQPINDDNNATVGRGRGGLSLRGRGGFPGAGQKSSPFTKKTMNKPSKPKDPGPNPIILDDLKVAAIKGNCDAVAKLLDQGIAVDYVLPSGWTTLMHAARIASDDVVELLLNRSANANYQKDMFTVLMAVCDCDSAVDEEKVLHCVELLVEHGAKTSVYDRHRMSPLMYATRQGRVAVCEKLIEKGAQVNKTDARGWTALSWAASKGHGRLIRVLLDHKADPKLYTLDGQSPSDIAYSTGYHVIAGILEAAASGNLGKRAELALSSTEDDKIPDNNISAPERYGELEVLLCGLQLGHLVPKFQEHQVTFQGFAKMTDKDLDQIGVTQVGVRQKILDAIREIHVKEWDMSSLKRQKNLLSAQDVTSVIANVSKHLSVIESSVVYAHKQLDNVTEPNEFVQDVAEAEGLIFFAKEAVKNSESLREHIDSLQTRCNELSTQTKLLSADLIQPKKQSTSTSRRGLLLFGLATVALGIMYARKAGMPFTASS